MLIPSYIQVGAYQERIDYEGQTRTGRKCHQPGHKAKACTAYVKCRDAVPLTIKNDTVPKSSVIIVENKATWKQNAPNLKPNFLHQPPKTILHSRLRPLPTNKKPQMTLGVCLLPIVCSSTICSTPFSMETSQKNAEPDQTHPP